MTELTPVESLDFEAIYRGDSPLVALIGDALVPWDIHGPQPALVELERTGQISGHVLDAGCGTGDNALFLAGRGYRVTGFDAAPAAIEAATRRARGQEPNPDFVVADATGLTGLDGRFDTVVDSALYHCLDETQRPRYIAALHRVCRPGGRLHLICFSDAKPMRNPALHQISEAELRRTLATGWRITTLRPTSYLLAFTADHIARLATALGYRSADECVEAELERDAEGRFYNPCWLVTAERR